MLSVRSKDRGLWTNITVMQPRPEISYKRREVGNSPESSEEMPVHLAHSGGYKSTCIDLVGFCKYISGVARRLWGETVWETGS